MTQKEVIYIDSEDDITAVIDKLSSADAAILALVLPKRYTTLKSSVNMKLLKKTADSEKKKVVLITNDSALLPLAGSAGVHVADSLKSRPEVPKVEKTANGTNSIIEEEDPELDENATIEELTETKKVTKKKSSEKSEKIKKIKEASSLKVPRFDKFRLRVFLAILAVILLISGYVVAFKVMPKAAITIQAQTSRVQTDFDLSLNPNLKSNKLTKNIVVGEVKEISKTLTERFDGSGEKNVGKKATGTMTVQNCETSEDVTIAAGTTFTDSSTGYKFISTEAVVVPGGTISLSEGCTTPGSADVAVRAAESGDSRNLSARGYTVSGVSSNITGFGSAMSGGTTEIVKVISAEDISQAKQTLLNKTDETVKAELVLQFKGEAAIVDGTFTITNTPIVSSVKPGAEATEGSVSAEFTYSIIGIPNDVMGTLLEQEQATKVDTAAQSILDNGLSTLKLTIKQENDDGSYDVNALTVGYVGPEINSEALANEISGKKYSEAIEIIKAKPGVRDVNIDLNPFWVFSVPGPEKTTIVVEVSDDTLQ